MAPQTRQWVLIGKAVLALLRGKGVNLYKQLIPSESADYQTWRHRFLASRIGLCLRVALAALLTLFVQDLFRDVILPLRYSSGEPGYQWLLVNGLLIPLVLVMNLVLQRTQFGRRYLAVLFLCLSWSLTLVPQLIPTLWGVLELDINNLIYTWCIVLTALATLIPVCWWLHLLSQLGVLVYCMEINSILSWTTYDSGTLTDYVSLFLYMFLFCFICDLAVYLYEHLQRNEFKSRRELRVFLHSVSHDLRAPVMGTSIVLQNLLKKSDDKITVSRSVLQQLLQGSDRQLKLIESLLEAHSTETQGIVLHRQPCQLSTLVQSVLLDLEPMLEKNRVILTNRVSADLPSLNADSTQLWRVFSNLINNALKHNPPGICLTLSATVEDKVIRCSVADNGVGMNWEQCQRLFELYARGERARRMPGLGLGLYLCRQIITAHGGKIGVTSSLGAGTTLWFTLPLD